MAGIVGIDLGTACGVVAVPEERSGEGFLSLPGCPGCSIILDRYGRRSTPAVVAEDLRGNLVVGHPARAQAGRVLPPITFAGRWLGEDKTFPLGRQGTLTPVDVAAHLLRHLKELAEFRLGEAVTEAVLAVPAYSSLRTRQLTVQAAERAGLRVVQFVPEPLAAALVYCAADPRESLRVLTYDLGGSAFDVAILERCGGVFGTDSIRAFDGDRFLGGRDFDRLLASWLVDQLNAQGYDLRLDPDDPADSAVFARLMLHAERARIELSRYDHHLIAESSSGLVDHAGNPVVIELDVHRADFEAMIGPLIEKTLQVCHRALLERADRPIVRDQIDEIVLVGGSSRIPLVARRLEQEFGRKPRSIEPELCVALGAALVAATRAPCTVDRLPTATDPGGTLVDVTDVLPGSLGILTNRGVQVIAPARTPLPFRTVIRVTTADVSGQLRIQLLEGSSLLGELVIKDLPPNLPAGSAVEITLTVEANYQLHGRAYMPALNREQSAVIDLKPRPLPALEELRARCEDLGRRADDVLAGAGRSALFGDPGARSLRHLLRDARQMLEARGTDCARIRDCLDEVEELLRRLNAGWDPEPSRAHFEEQIREAEEALALVVRQRPEAAQAGHDKRLAAVRAEAEKAHVAQNAAAWQRASREVIRLRDELERSIERHSGSASPPDPGVVLLQLARALDELARRAMQDGIYPEAQDVFIEAKADLEQIDPRASDALAHLRDWYHTSYEELERWVTGYKVGDGGSLRGGEGGGKTVRPPPRPARKRPVGSPMPAASVDRVHFSVTAPAALTPDASCVVDVWAHLEQQRTAVLQRAREAAGGAEIRLQSKGPVQVARGTVLSVRLKVEGLVLDDPEDTLLWEGEIGNARFPVRVPADAVPGPRNGLATVHADGLQIAKLHFTLTIGPGPAAASPLPLREERHRKAFASYAGDDREQVLARLQGMQKVLPTLEVFLDVHSLRSGQDWEQELWRAIPGSDVFYLFWSENARQSPWVEKEWRCALAARGLDFIDPVPLVSPQEVPPPPELAGKHFNDWVLAFMRAPAGHRGE